MNLIFWQNTPSIHQAPLMRALAPMWKEKIGGDVFVVCENQIAKSRIDAGWEIPDFGAAILEINPNLDRRDEILNAYQSKHDIHVFTGFDMTPLNAISIKKSLEMPCYTGVYLERPGSDQRIKSLLRRLKYFLYAYKYRNIDFMLAIGSLAQNYYKSCGFQPDIIYPFGYFTQATILNSISMRNKSDTVRFSFVGRNVPLKRLDLLLSAFEIIKENKNWACDVIGVDSAEANKKFIISDQLKEKIVFHGVLPNSAVQDILRSSDCLVLCSSYDGWGAVVNEALQNGCRALVSSAAGSKDIVSKNENLGGIFKSGDLKDLVHNLDAVIRKGSLCRNERENIAHIAQEMISPIMGAEYLLRILSHVSDGNKDKPKAPWI